MTKLTKQGVRDLDPPQQKNQQRRPQGLIAGRLHRCPECRTHSPFCPLCEGTGFVEYKEKRRQRDE